MTLTIELPTELEQQLQTQAQQLGVEPTDIALDAMVFYLSALDTLNQRAGRLNRPKASLEAVSPYTAEILSDEAIAARVGTVRSIGAYDTRSGAGLPPLSDEDISRESIYGERGL